MGAALGYALTKSAAEAVAVLLALGVGFASPLVLLSVSPHLRHMLPKPGAWMETLKQVMAFPMYASAAWLVWVLSIERGSDGVLAAAVAVVGIGFAAWLAGRLQNAGGVWRWAPLAVAVALMVSAAGMLSAAPVSVEPQGQGETSGFGEPFSPERLDALRAEGHPVFVNMTAAWCITCKVNERMALTSERVRAEFKRRNIAYLKGDWTNNDPRITEVLRSFNRVGVPLYLIYPPKSAGGQPDVLPQLLTESIVMDHLSQLPLTKAEGDLPNGKKQ
jgi:thiol:disulfide interchange protein DsbD